MLQHNNIEKVDEVKFTEITSEIKIDWLTLTYHYTAEEPEQFNQEVERLEQIVVETLELELIEQKPNLYRDEIKKIAIKKNRKFISIEFEGSYFSKDRLQEIKKIYKNLEEKTGVYFSISRLDIAKTFINTSIEKLIPSHKEYDYFKCKKSEIYNSYGELETLYLTTSKIQFCIYRKDYEIKNNDKFLENKKLYERKYKDFPTTRVEVRLLSGNETLKKVITEFIENKFETEKEFCDVIFKEIIHKRPVKIKESGKRKKDWKIESRWRQIFQSSENRIRVDEAITNYVSKSKQAVTEEREINRLKNFMKKNELTINEITELLKKKGIE